MQVRLRSGGSTCAWGAEASRSNKICRTGRWKNTEDVDPVPGSKPMIRALGVVLVYFVMLGAWVAVGLFIVIAPARFGNLVNLKTAVRRGHRRDDQDFRGPCRPVIDETQRRELA